MCVTWSKSKTGVRRIRCHSCEREVMNRKDTFYTLYLQTTGCCSSSTLSLFHFRSSCISSFLPTEAVGYFLRKCKRSSLFIALLPRVAIKTIQVYCYDHPKVAIYCDDVQAWNQLLHACLTWLSILKGEGGKMKKKTRRGRDGGCNMNVPRSVSCNINVSLLWRLMRRSFFKDRSRGWTAGRW